MKILHIVSSYYPFVGGIENLVADLVNEQRIAGHDPVILFPDRLNKFPNPYTHRDVSVIPFSFPEMVIPWFMIGVPLNMKNSPKTLAIIFAHARSILSSESPDIIHLHNASEIALPFMAIAKSLGIPSVLHWHTLVRSKNIKSVESLVLKQAKNIVAVSEATRDTFVPFISPNSNITVIPNGIYLENLPTRIQSKLFNIIVIASRFDKGKGVDLGIRTFAKIAQKYPLLELHIAGNGPERKNLLSLVRELRMEKRVKFLGTLNRSDLHDIIAMSRCVLIPTPENEAFSLLAAEAMCIGVPIVATNIGGLPEVIDSEKTGLLVSPNVESLGTAICRILDDFEMAENLGIIAKEQGKKKFNIKRLNGDVFEIYNSLL